MAIAHRPMILIVMDGWGYSDNTQYNAIHSANKPVWDELWSLYPHILLRCSGTDVGLPERQMGNSEVGHMHMGAGRIVNQDFTRIQETISDRSFFENETLTTGFRTAASNDRAIHIMGLLSPGGVHGHEDQILALIELAASCGARKIYIHGFLDGRDMAPKSAAESIQRVMMKCNEIGTGQIASLIGRFYAMDRNKNWERTQAAYELICNGVGEFQSNDPLIALDQAYERGETDEFVHPTTIVRRDSEPVQVEDGDVCVFMNYRADRARQLTRAFIKKNLKAFERTRFPSVDSFISLTAYSAEYDIPVAFPPEHLVNTFGEYIAGKGLQQLRIAETEKYAHVTFFFNGGEERVFEGEDRILVPSPHVHTYDEKPEMSANEVTGRLVEAIYSNKYDAIICNYANADMVGHSGNFEATVKAIEAVDKCLGRVIGAGQAVGGEILVTSDHGNAEKMRGVSTKFERGQRYTAHTTNLVPLIHIGRPSEFIVNSGSLIDIAPTMLNLMGIAIPEEMTGRPLLQAEDEVFTTGRERPHERLARYMR